MRAVRETVKLSFLICAVVVVTSVFANGQGFGQRGANTRGGATRTPPAPAQLAANQLLRIARFLQLNSSDTSTLTGNTGLVSDLTAEETTLQTNAAAIRAAYTALATDIATGNTADETTQETTIETTNNSSLQARITAAGQVLSALPSLGISVTSAQATTLAEILISGPFGR